MTIWRDEKALRDHILDTIDIVVDLREKMTGTMSAAYDEDIVSGGGGAGSKPPLSLDLLQVADYEVATVGALARQCKRWNTINIPPLTMFSGDIQGNITGLSTRPGSLAAFQRLTALLSYHADKILATEDAVVILWDWEKLRNISRIYSPIARTTEWLTTKQAAEVAGVGKSTIHEWTVKGWVEHRFDEEGHLWITKESLMNVESILLLRKGYNKAKRNKRKING